MLWTIPDNLDGTTIRPRPDAKKCIASRGKTRTSPHPSNQPKDPFARALFVDLRMRDR
jgi:hypothetical protein